MTTTKNENKGAGIGTAQRAADPKALRTAYEINTLAMMIRSQLAEPTPTWGMPAPTMGFDPRIWAPPMACTPPMPSASQQWAVPTHWPW